MKNSIAVFGLILFSSYLLGQNIKKTLNPVSTTISIKWTDHLPGDFSFTKKWSYPEGVYKMNTDS